ncbi:MAG: heat-inducible transcriptional repressor HrcA, partial [Terriglobales bacterium]
MGEASQNNPGGAADGALAGREATILQGLLEAYMATGNPVGSLALAQSAPAGGEGKHLSPATIRHVLVELEQAGYLAQPHVSAGREPTAKAIRWWVQQVAAPLADAASARQLERRLREASDEAGLWTLASEYLSGASQQVGVVAVHPWRDAGLKQLRFFRLTERRVLAILVAGDGEVRERVIRVPESYSQAELDAASRYFNHNFAGATLTRIQRELQRKL